MLKYFDKDFFKFTFGFLALVSLSLIIIIATRYYADSMSQEANVSSAILN